MTALADLLDGPVEEVAPRLLGAVLRHGPVAVRLTEVEAYAGPDDPGSHSFRGPTRTQPGDVRTARAPLLLPQPRHPRLRQRQRRPRRDARRVLLRAGEVVDGIEVARAFRPRAADRDLARGPGRLGRALGIRLDHYGTDLTQRRDHADAGRAGRAGRQRAADRPAGGRRPAVAVLDRRRSEVSPTAATARGEGF